MKNKIKMLLKNPMRLSREFIKDTYFDRNRSLGSAYFFLAYHGLLVAALIGTVIFGFVGLICLAVSCLLSWVGLGTIVDKVMLFPYIAATVGILSYCIALGATEGIRMYKEYLRLPLD